MRLALVAVQLHVDADVLASGEAYRAHLAQAMEHAVAAARAGGEGPDHTLVVFPELAGHLALLALAPPAARRQKTVAAAFAQSALRRPLEVLRGVVTTRLLDPQHAVMAALAPDAEKFWRAVFGPLARRHAAHVVSGSHLRLGSSGEITSSSFTFAPDGRVLATTSKVNLVPGVEDRQPGGLGLARGEATAIPIVDTPFGTLATLIGYDGAATPYSDLERFTPVGPRLAARGGVTVVANPEADRAGTIGHRAGLSEALVATPFARYSVMAHMAGGVLDLAFAGQSEILERTATGLTTLARSAGAAGVLAATVTP